MNWLGAFRDAGSYYNHIWKIYENKDDSKEGVPMTTPWCHFALYLCIDLIDGQSFNLRKGELVLLSLLPSLLSQLQQLSLPCGQLIHLTDFSLLQTFLNANQLSLYLIRCSPPLPYRSYSRTCISLYDAVCYCFVLSLHNNKATLSNER